MFVFAQCENLFDFVSSFHPSSAEQRLTIVDRPVYRTFLCTLLPSDDGSWYDDFFIEMRKNAVQLCYLGRGTPASVADLRQDDYFISFFYFDSDGDMNVMDTAKEFKRVLISAAQQGLTQVKVKADVTTKPDRILGKMNAINSPTQLCVTMFRKMKSLRMAAEGSGSEMDRFPTLSRGDDLRMKTMRNPSNPNSRKMRTSSQAIQPLNQIEKHNVQKNSTSQQNIRPVQSTDPGSTNNKSSDSLSFYATNCRVTVVDASATKTSSSTIKQETPEKHVASPPRLLSVLPMYGCRRKKVTTDSAWSDSTEQVKNSKISNSNSENVNASISVEENPTTVRKDVKVVKRNNALDFSISNVSDDYDFDAFDIWKHEGITQEDDYDNLSTQVLWQDLDRLGQASI